MQIIFLIVLFMHNPILSDLLHTAVNFYWGCGERNRLHRYDALACSGQEVAQPQPLLYSKLFPPILSFKNKQLLLKSQTAKISSLVMAACS